MSDRQRVLEAGMASERIRPRSARVEPHVVRQRPHGGWYRRGVAPLPTDRRSPNTDGRQRRRRLGRSRRQLQDARRPDGSGCTDMGTRRAHVRPTAGQTRRHAPQTLQQWPGRLALRPRSRRVSRARRTHRRRSSNQGETHPGGGQRIPHVTRAARSRRAGMGTSATGGGSDAPGGDPSGGRPQRRTRSNGRHGIPPPVQRWHHQVGIETAGNGTGPARETP